MLFLSEWPEKLKKKATVVSSISKGAWVLSVGLKTNESDLNYGTIAISWFIPNPGRRQQKVSIVAQKNQEIDLKSKEKYRARHTRGNETLNAQRPR